MISHAILDKLNELERIMADKAHPNLFSSDHETYAVLKEEKEEASVEFQAFEEKFNKMWDAIKEDNHQNVEDLLIDMKVIIYNLFAEVVQMYTVCDKGIDSGIANEQRKK